jgi:DNA recombination protein RmuC
VSGTVYILIAFFSGIGLGGFFAYLLFRTKYLSLETQLKSQEAECQEKTQRLQEVELELRDALDKRARAEENVKRIPELESELSNLRKENTDLRAEIAELKKERETDKEKILWIEKAQAQMREAFHALASEALKSNAEEFLKHARTQLENLVTQMRGDLLNQKTELRSLMEPLENTLRLMDSQIRELEQKREGAYQGLKEQLRQLAQVHEQLQITTVSLVQALKSPTVRGRWGEYQLRRIVEMAGMLEHVDFEEQSATDRGRPDMVIYLPNEGILPVDAKTPMQAYLEAQEAESEEKRLAKLSDHARSMRERVRELGQRQYYKQFGRTPDFVIMFVPNDACLSAAFEREPDLLDFAIQQRVFPATPLSLLALLKAVAYGWQQHKIAENAREIAKQGKELYERLSKFVEHIGKTGASLGSAIKYYNEAVGSLESRLLPVARRFKDLCAVMEEIKSPQSIEQQARLPFGVDENENAR